MAFVIEFPFAEDRVFSANFVSLPVERGLTGAGSGFAGADSGLTGAGSTAGGVDSLAIAWPATMDSANRPITTPGSIRRVHMGA